MTLWTDVFANSIALNMQIMMVVVTVFFVLSEIQIASGRKISFANFLTNQKFYNLSSPRIVQILIIGLLAVQFVLMLLSLAGSGVLYAALYLINVAVMSILWMFSLSAEAGNLDLSRFSPDFRTIKRMEASLDTQKELIKSMQDELNSFETKVRQVRGEFSTFTTTPIFENSKNHVRDLHNAIEKAKNNDINRQVQALKKDFEQRVIRYVRQEIYVPTSIKEQEIPGVTEFQQLITSTNDVLKDDINHSTSFIFADFSTFSEADIIGIIELAKKYGLSVTEVEVRRILDRVAKLNNKQELINLLYKANGITAEIIISYLEDNQDWIITPQMYEILNQGNLSSILGLLINKNLIESAKRFLQSLPANKLQILYRVTGEVKNETADLIIEFRHFLPLKYLFSDPSTMYFNMFSALQDSDIDLLSMIDDSDPQTLRKGLIVNKKTIKEKYELAYQKSSNLRTQFEAVKLNLLSSNLQQSGLIRLESSIELFYQYVINLRQKEAKILFEFLEAIFLIEETDKLKVEDLIKNKGTSPNPGMSIAKYIETGKSKLRQLLRTEKALLRQIISRVEVARLGYDQLELLVKS